MADQSGGQETSSPTKPQRMRLEWQRDRNETAASSSMLWLGGFS